MRAMTPDEAYHQMRLEQTLCYCFKISVEYAIELGLGLPLGDGVSKEDYIESLCKNDPSLAHWQELIIEPLDRCLGNMKTINRVNLLIEARKYRDRGDGYVNHRNFAPQLEYLYYFANKLELDEHF